MKYWLAIILVCLSAPVGGWSEEAPQTPTLRSIPGEEPTPFLLYENSSARTVAMGTSGDRWAGRHPLQPRRGRTWALDIRPLKLRFGRHEYKFIVDGEWEPGENRILHINENGLLERPPDVIKSARVQTTNLIELLLKTSVKDPSALRVASDPPLAIRELRLSSPREDGYVSGYVIQGPLITFYFNPTQYGVKMDPDDVVTVAGNFNHWDAGSRGSLWQLRDPRGTGLWEMTIQWAGLRIPTDEDSLQFKFVINGERWLAAPPHAPNAEDDGKGNVNLRIDLASSGGTTLQIHTDTPLKLTQNYLLMIDGLADRRVFQMTSPGDLMDTLYSDKELGVILDRVNGTTTYRLFAPRATSVHLCLYDRPEYEIRAPKQQRVEPRERYPLWRDPADHVWEVTLLGLDIGRYYSFNVAGPEGNAEGFLPEAQIGDPYARAVAIDSDYNNIVIDPEETNEWFAGWTDDAYRAPAHEDMIIYETHVRDMTMHPSSKVPPALRGTYAGLLASEGTGTGLDHLKSIGVNMIELLPVQEFHNPGNEYDWGYATAFFFAPEASYGRDAAKGSQYYEFKNLVNELHRKGFGVVLDVVYNHVGSPNVFSMIDRKYYFRLNPDYTFSNFSGVGNDVRSEAPMMRRLIIDNICYLMKEFHIDGFRFDLAELIDMETLMQLREEAIKINPDVLLISEPWSFRGTHKYELTGTGWSAWNDDFRYTVKGLAMGERNLERLRKVLTGSGELWTANPMQAVNYVESHDDMSLADELTTRPDRDGRRLQTRDVAANRLTATVLFTSLGIPMLQSGQEFLRSKKGISNTYNRGDEVNALRWTDRDRPAAAEALAYYKALMQLRQSPAGASFRVTRKPPPTYYRWIETRNAQALGYIVNSPRVHPGNSFIVLLNASHESVSFPVPIPAGQWRLIGNGRELNPEGLPKVNAIQGPVNTNIRVPSLSSVILMDGFQ